MTYNDKLMFHCPIIINMTLETKKSSPSGLAPNTIQQTGASVQTQSPRRQVLLRTLRVWGLNKAGFPMQDGGSAHIQTEKKVQILEIDTSHWYSCSHLRWNSLLDNFSHDLISSFYQLWFITTIVAIIKIVKILATLCQAPFYLYSHHTRKMPSFLQISEREYIHMVDLKHIHLSHDDLVFCCHLQLCTQ